MLNLDMFLLFALIAFILYYTTIRCCNRMSYDHTIILPVENSEVVTSTVHELPTVPELPASDN
jgi:hypothetical protein